MKWSKAFIYAGKVILTSFFFQFLGLLLMGIGFKLAVSFRITPWPHIPKMSPFLVFLHSSTVNLTVHAPYLGILLIMSGAILMILGTLASIFKYLPEAILEEMKLKSS